MTSSAAGELNLGGRKPRTLLAEFLLAQGEAVSIDRLVDTLWGDKVPARPTSLLHTYVSTLRTALHDRHGSVLTRRLPGYAWEVGSGRLDLTEFERLPTAAGGRWTPATTPPARPCRPGRCGSGAVGGGRWNAASTG
jgi:DNA-binding SARP family transcriptional activator